MLVQVVASLQCQAQVYESRYIPVRWLCASDLLLISSVHCESSLTNDVIDDVNTSERVKRNSIMAHGKF